MGKAERLGVKRQIVVKDVPIAEGDDRNVGKETIRRGGGRGETYTTIDRALSFKFLHLELQQLLFHPFSMPRLSVKLDCRQLLSFEPIGATEASSSCQGPLDTTPHPCI